jgi:hypothetical protein
MPSQTGLDAYHQPSQAALKASGRVAQGERAERSEALEPWVPHQRGCKPCKGETVWPRPLECFSSKSFSISRHFGIRDNHFTCLKNTSFPSHLPIKFHGVN